LSTHWEIMAIDLSSIENSSLLNSY
jgi:hypothetical protein